MAAILNFAWFLFQYHFKTPSNRFSTLKKIFIIKISHRDPECLPKFFYSWGGPLKEF